MARLKDLGVTKVAWVETLSNPNAPTVAELTAGEDLSSYLLPSYSLGFSDSDTVSERAINETANSASASIENYEGNLDLFRDYDEDGDVSTTDISTIWPDGTYKVGYLVRRIGPKSAVAWAASQVVEVYKFEADRLKVNGGVDAGYLKASIKMNPQGFGTTKAVVAGA